MALFTSFTSVYISYRLQITSLIAKKGFIKIFTKYANFANMFSLDLASKFSKYIKINNHAIELINGQQPPF